MAILYNDERKDLPNDQLHRLFAHVGWSDEEIDPYLFERFNMPFINSTLVVSAWEGERLVGVVRVLSDRITRSVIYDLAVEPDHQGQGTGGELLRRCRAHFPDSGWLVATEPHIIGYYEKQGFQPIHESECPFLGIQGKYC